MQLVDFVMNRIKFLFEYFISLYFQDWRGKFGFLCCPQISGKIFLHSKDIKVVNSAEFFSPLLVSPVLRIQICRFLDLQDPDPLVRVIDPDPVASLFS
jgi:hypothetical protein